MKIYVSMSSADLDQARENMKKLTDLGHEVVLDWTKSFGEDVPVSAWPSKVLEDVDKVSEAEVMVLFGEPTRGCYVELGAAISSRMPVIWMTPGKPGCEAYFFLHYPGLYQVDNWDSLSVVLGFLSVVYGHL